MKVIAALAILSFLLVPTIVQADVGHGLTKSLPKSPQRGAVFDYHDAPAGWQFSSQGPLPSPIWEGQDAQNEFIFRCPEVTDSVYTVAGCPAGVFDAEDIMSQPVLVIDPRSPVLMGFHALHGGRGLQALPGDETPTERSRSDSIHQPHTLFQSRDGGLSWTDRRYYSPWNCQSENPALDCTEQQQAGVVPGVTPRRANVWGEDNAVALDAQGRVYLASLYTVEDPNLGDGLHYRVATWRGGRLSEDMQYDVNRVILDSATPNNALESLHLAYARATDTVVLVWREQAPNPDPATGFDSWLQIHYTKPGKSARWAPLETRFGPCSTISNAVAQGATVYVACRRELSRGDGNDANATGFRLLAIDTNTMNVTDAGPLPFTRGTHPVLADTRQQYLVAAIAGVEESGESFADVAFGLPGTEWSGPLEFGNDLRNATATIPRQEARITAIAFREDVGHLYVLYMERFPADPTDAANTAREYYKSLGNIGVRGTRLEWLGKANLVLGDPASRMNFSPTFQGAGQGVFNDLKDSLVVTHDDQGKPHVWVAYGDFGMVRFAQIDEDSPVVMFGFPFPPAVPPIPLLAPGVNPALVGALAGTLSMAMVLRMLAAKKKATVEAPSL